MGCGALRKSRESTCDFSDVSGGSGKAGAIDPENLRSSWNLRDIDGAVGSVKVPYDWRTRAICTSNALLASETGGRNVDTLKLRGAVQKSLQGQAFRKKPPSMSKKAYVQWMYRRTQMLTKSGGPRMRVVWWRTLKELGRIPRWPQDKHHILDLEKLLQIWLKKCDKQGRVDGRFCYIWMLSHRWERPHFCADCMNGMCEEAKTAHPDTSENTKATTLGAWGAAEYDDSNVGPHAPDDFYVWIDFASIDQDDAEQKIRGIEMLPLYVACCSSGLVMYIPDNPATNYEERAWTGIERILAYTFSVSPVLKKIDSGFISGRSKWTAEALTEVKQDFWKMEHGALCFNLTDPAQGQLTCPEQDLPTIEALRSIATSTPAIDFDGNKAPLMLGRTTFRVQDTCRTRATIFSRRTTSMGSHRTSRASSGNLDGHRSSVFSVSSDFGFKPLEKLKSALEGAADVVKKVSSSLPYSRNNSRTSSIESSRSRIDGGVLRSTESSRSTKSIMSSSRSNLTANWMGRTASNSSKASTFLAVDKMASNGSLKSDLTDTSQGDRLGRGRSIRLGGTSSRSFNGTVESLKKMMGGQFGGSKRCSDIAEDNSKRCSENSVDHDENNGDADDFPLRSPPPLSNDSHCSSIDRDMDVDSGGPGKEVLETPILSPYAMPSADEDDEVIEEGRFDIATARSDARSEHSAIGVSKSKSDGMSELSAFKEERQRSRRNEEWHEVRKIGSQTTVSTGLPSSTGPPFSPQVSQSVMGKVRSSTSYSSSATGSTPGDFVDKSSPRTNSKSQWSNSEAQLLREEEVLS